jgi:hypothetical protein
MRIVPLQLYLCAAISVLLGACTSTPVINRETNSGAAFGSYKTFGFLSPLATDKFPYESLLTQHFKDATRRTMESKGYVFSASAPDLQLNFYVNIQDKQDNTLTIDLVDTKQQVLAWTATAEGRISNDALTTPGPAIDTLVTNMMAPLAAASGSTHLTARNERPSSKPFLPPLWGR